MQGTLILADIALTFVVEANKGEDREAGTLTVKDCLTGQSQTVRDIDPEALFAALIVALDGNQGRVDQAVIDLAESVQNEFPQELRFIP